MSITKEELEDFIFNKKLSYEEIGRMFNVSGSAIRKRARYIGIILPIRRKINPCETFNKNKTTNKEEKKCPICGRTFKEKPINKFCSKQCYLNNLKIKKEKRYKEYVLANGENMPQKANYNPRWIKNFLLKEQSNKCAICGIENTWNNKPLVFILDHIDGDAGNNRKNNFRLICSNCDSQLDTYKSKNKNGSRSYYRYKNKS